MEDQIIQTCSLRIVRFLLIFTLLVNWFSVVGSNEFDDISLLSNSEAGNYLSWAHAENSGNPQDAKTFLYGLKNSIKNREIIKKAFFTSLLINEWKLALKFARKIVSFDDSNFFVNVVLSTDEFMKGDFKSSEFFLQSISTTDIDENFVDIIQSWHKFSKGEKVPYSAILGKKEQQCIPLNCLHIALIGKLMGQNNVAKKNFDFLKSQDFKSFRLLEVLFNFYNSSSDNESADYIYKVLKQNDFEIESYDSFVEKRKSFDPIENSSDGLAEAYANIAGWFYEQGLYKFSAYFSVIGLQIRPELSSLRYLLSNIYFKLNFDNLVLSSVKNVKLENLYYLKTLSIKLKSLSNLGNNEIIINDLKDLVARFPHRDDYKLYLADILRNAGFHQESINYYDNILKGIINPKKEDWGIFYSRGISHERLKNWERSEKDLLKAIELKPDAAYVLNYLGYSWLERKINVKKALKLIINANKLEPEDAFITDSLGWAYYLLGEYEKSIKILEKAILTLPFDSTLNDHLGDAYWKVGRKQEAYSQWKKVLVYDPDFKYKSIVIHKISFGL